MSMSKSKFKNAFREVVSSEFAHIPCDEGSIDYTFSERFNKKMDKLIKAQRKSYYFLINTAAKRVAVIFVAFLTMFTASMSVKAIREPVINFVVEVYESFTRYFFDGDTTDNIDKVYTITDLPSGFTEFNKFENETNITTVYQNSNGNIIEFTQGISDNTTFNIDTENSIYKEIYVNKIKYLFHVAWTSNNTILRKERTTVMSSFPTQI